jgi:hypothetical protein
MADSVCKGRSLCNSDDELSEKKGDELRFDLQTAKFGNIIV